MIKITSLVFLALICGAISGPADLSALVVRQRDAEIFSNTKQLIVELIQNLRKAATQALDAIGIFAAGLQAQWNLFLEKLSKDLQKLRDQVEEVLSNISYQILSAAFNIYEQCITPNQIKIQGVLNDIENKTLECANSNVDHIKELMDEAKHSTEVAMEYADGVIVQMKNCTNGKHVIESGTCLGALAFNTEIKSAIFIAKSALLMSRINIAIATLPAALEVCAGARLVEAGIGTAKIIMDTGACAFSPPAPVAISNATLLESELEEI